LAHLVMQCLEKKAADRPQSAEEVLRQLDQVLTPSGGLTPTDTRPYQTASARRARRKNLLTGTAVVAGLAVIGMLGWEWWQGRSTQFPPLVDSATEAGVHRIAVLPFENIGDSANTYFADGIADAVRGKLMGLTGIDVIARGSSLEYRGTDKRPNIIASELGVRYLLTGTVRFATVAGTQHVQVSPELVEIGDDGIPHGRWQEPYEAEVKDVFRVQGEIAQRVAEAMRLALADTVRARLVRAPTTDSAAYDFYLRALEVSRDVSRLDGATRAIALLEQAVARDSMMIEAWELASMIHSWIQTNWPTPQNDEAALVKAQRALALAPRGAAGHRALARYYQLREPAKALQEVELALRVEPDDIGSLTLRADAMLEVGIDSGDTTSEAFASSLRDGERVLRLDPRSAAAWSRQTRRLLHLRRVGDARLTATRTLALAPASLGAVRQRVLVELIAGDLDAARHVLTSARNDHDRTRLVAHMAEYYDLGWVLDTDDERLLLTLGPEAFGSPLSYALVRSQQYRWRGDTVRARAGWDSVGPQLAARAQTETGLLQMANNGLALAYAGQAREALAVVERAEAQLRSSGLPGYGYHWYMHARTALLAGDRTRAIELLRRVLRLPYFVTPAWLRIDPSWDALRGYPPFEELLKPKG
jgi:TolB-like protein